MNASFLVTLAVGTPAADAAEVGVSPFLGVFLPSSKHELYDPTGDAYTPYSAAGVGLGARASLLPLSFVGGEGELEYVGLGTQGNGGASLLGWRAHAMLIAPLDTVQPFFVVGVGNLASFSKPEANGKDVDAAFHWGVGARYAVQDGLFLRADFRDDVTSTHGIVKSPTNHFEFNVGAMWTFGGKPKILDTDGDLILDDVDKCTAQPEAINGYNDTDGCPDLLANAQITVVNEDGEPVPDAKVVFGGKELTLDASGKAQLVDLMPGTTLGGSVEHPLYKPATVDDATLVEGGNDRTLKLFYLPGKVRVITKADGGAIVDATLAFHGPVEKDPVAVGDDGQEVVELRPGAWRLLLSAETFGTERRELIIKPGETSLVVIEVVLRPAKATVTVREIKALEQVLFEFDSDRIADVSMPLLVEVANTLLQFPEIKLVEVGGHTDDKGNDGYNVELSQKRVEAVVAFLVQQGVDAKRLIAKGYGETMPVAPNTSEENRAANRRVEFVILDPKPTKP